MAGTFEITCESATDDQYVSNNRSGNVRSPSTMMDAKKKSGTIERSTRQRRMNAAEARAASAAGQPFSTRAISSIARIPVTASTTAANDRALWNRATVFSTA
ncbi:MAG TPA: hypothetical protein VGJ81_06105 [Thermoanaerobaculia bacterium]